MEDIFSLSKYKESPAENLLKIGLEKTQEEKKRTKKIMSFLLIIKILTRLQIHFHLILTIQELNLLVMQSRNTCKTHKNDSSNNFAEKKFFHNRHLSIRTLYHEVLK